MLINRCDHGRIRVPHENTDSDWIDSILKHSCRIAVPEVIESEFVSGFCVEPTHQTVDR